MRFEGPSPRSRDASIRRFGLLLFPLTLATGAVGVASATGGSSVGPAILYAHIALGVTVVGLSGVAVWQASRLPAWTVRLATGIAFGGSATAALTGSVFLAQGLGGAAVLDRVLALIALAGGALMIVWGSVRIGRPEARVGDG